MMEKFIIKGGNPLKGEITVSGAKNSAVALIPAAIMADSPVVIEGVPEIDDVFALIEILKDFNVDVDFNEHVLRMTQRTWKIFQCLMVRSKACAHLTTSWVPY